MKASLTSSNSNQAIWLGIGQLSNLILSLLSAGILSRYFDKVEYGTYKQILYIYNTLLVLFSAGLNGAYSYFLPKQNMAQGKGFVVKLIKTFILLGLGFSISLYLLAPLISDLFKNPDLRHGLRLFSIVPVLMLPTNGLNGVYATIRRTHVIAIYTVITRLFMLVLITLPVILLRGTYITAVYGWIIASFITCLVAIYLILRPFSEVKRTPSIFSYSDIFKYSLPLMVATLYGIFIRFADQFYVSRYYGAETFAEFSNGFIDLPFVAMMAGATTTVLFPLFTKYSESEGGIALICQTWKSSIGKSVVLTFPLLVFFMFNSTNSVLALYGKQYASSAKYFIIAMMIGFFNVIVFHPVLFAFGKTRLYSRIHLFQALAIWITGALIVYFNGSSWLYALFSRLFYIAQVCVGIFYATKVLGLRPKDVIPFRMILKALAHSIIICGLVTWSLNLIEINVFIKLILSGIICAITISLTGDFFNIPYRSTIKSIFVSLPGRSMIKQTRVDSNELGVTR